jgi:hypothetical protein
MFVRLATLQVTLSSCGCRTGQNLANRDARFGRDFDQCGLRLIIASTPLCVSSIYPGILRLRERTPKHLQLPWIDFSSSNTKVLANLTTQLTKLRRTFVTDSLCSSARDRVAAHNRNRILLRYCSFVGYRNSI